MAREARRFDKTQLREAAHGQLVHRDYLAHFFRWQYVKGMKTLDANILDVGCGQDMPIVKILGHSKGTVPMQYVGVDMNRIVKPTSCQWAEILDETDFTSQEGLDKVCSVCRRFDIAICFEVIEHMEPADGARLLQNVRSVIDNAEGTFVLSTPCFSGKAAANHVHEYTIDELRELIESNGWRVEKRFGTFGDVNRLRKAASKEHAKMMDELSVFMSNDALACFLAPLYPDHCKNNMWVLKPA